MLSKSKEMDEQKIKEYFMKQDHLANTVYKKELSKKELLQKRSQSLNNIFLKTIENRQSQSKMYEKKKEGLLIRMEKSQKRIVEAQ